MLVQYGAAAHECSGHSAAQFTRVAAHRPLEHSESLFGVFALLAGFR